MRCQGYLKTKPKLFNFFDKRVYQRLVVLYLCENQRYDESLIHVLVGEFFPEVRLMTIMTPNSETNSVLSRASMTVHSYDQFANERSPC